jgi:hypothetical protein
MYPTGQPARRSSLCLRLVDFYARVFLDDGRVASIGSILFREETAGLAIYMRVDVFWGRQT